MKKTIIISLGGSVIVSDKINILFLKELRNLILKYIKKGHRFILICGGGRTCRIYQNAACSIKKLEKQDLDWLGICCTRLNALLIKTIFKELAYQELIDNPYKKVKFGKLLVACGWKPGFSTDYDAVILAKKYGSKEIINISNVDFVYDKDPKKFKNAKKIKNISWKDFRKLVGNKWIPGMNMPFDPVASKIAQKHGLTVHVVNDDLKNLDKLLSGKNFRGTTIK